MLRVAIQPVLTFLIDYLIQTSICSKSLSPERMLQGLFLRLSGRHHSGNPGFCGVRGSVGSPQPENVNGLIVR